MSEAAPPKLPSATIADLATSFHCNRYLLQYVCWKPENPSDGFSRLKQAAGYRLMSKERAKGLIDTV